MTGEQPAIATAEPKPVLSHNSTITIGLVLALVASAATSVAGYTQLKADVVHLREEVSALQKSREAATESNTTLLLRVQQVENNYAHILTSLGELKNEVRNLSHEGIRPARGGR